MPFLRLSSTFTDDTTAKDFMVIYYDEKAANGFDKDYDARKLMNTDYEVPNLYSVSADGINLSINALPESSDTVCSIPLGLRLYKTGEIIFRINDIVEGFPYKKISITDLSSGYEQDLLGNKEYKVLLNSDEYKNRFYLNLSAKEGDIPEIRPGDDLFYAFSSDGMIKVYISENLPKGNNILKIYNLAGQLLLIRKNLSTGYSEFNPVFKDGIYIAFFSSGKFLSAKKILVQSR